MINRRLARAASLLLVMTAAATSSVTASPTIPPSSQAAPSASYVYHLPLIINPRPQRLAFVSDRDGNQEIYVMKPDGSGQTNLTNHSANDGLPQWSPDGNKIAFSSNRDGVDFRIYVMNADGSGVISVAGPRDYNPAWSPDGSKIAFVSYRDSNDEIYVMNADGSNQRRLTNNASLDYFPAWSPDGAKIAFFESSDQGFVIKVMNADGSNQRQLVGDIVNGEPYWSPDGAKIGFRSYWRLSGLGEDVWAISIINADGSGLKHLTQNTMYKDPALTWSPDSRWIAFDAGGDLNRDIYAVNSDGSSVTNMTNDGSFNVDPKWSSDGSTIAFASVRDGNYEIYVINSDGTQQRRLTENTAIDNGAVWSPWGDFR